MVVFIIIIPFYTTVYMLFDVVYIIAALLVSARLHNFKRSVKDAATVVKLSEATVSKR